MATQAKLDTTRPASGRAITAFRWLVTAVLALCVIAAIVLTVEVFTSDSVFQLELNVAPTDIDAGYPAGASIVEATAYVDVEAGLGYRLLWWLVSGGGLAFLAIPFLEILRRMLAKGAEPFTAANERRLRWLIGLSLAFASSDLLRPIASIAIQDATGFDGFEASWDFTSLFVALLLSALLEVWRHGVALRSEQELTI